MARVPFVVRPVCDLLYTVYLFYFTCLFADIQAVRATHLHETSILNIYMYIKAHILNFIW